MASDQLDDLYDEVILDHSRSPRHSGRLDAPDVSARAVNPFCGDEIDLEIALDGDRVARVGLRSKGCAINRASGSMLAEAVDGKRLDELEVLSEGFTEMLRHGSNPGSDLDSLGDLRALEGVRQFPVRIKCALLPWSALQDAIEEYRSGSPSH